MIIENIKKESNDFKDFNQKIRKSIKNDKDLITKILDVTGFLDLEYNSPILVQRLWHIWNDNYNLVRCQFCNNVANLISENNISQKKNIVYHDICLDSKCRWDKICKLHNIEKKKPQIKLSPKEIKEKIRQTNLKKYGVDNPFKSEEIKEKIRQTNLKKYGVDNPRKNKDIVEKSKQTNLEKYGHDSFTRTEEYLVKSKKTCNLKYGVDHQMKSEVVKEKVRLANIEKYGSGTFCQSEQYQLAKNLETRSKIEEYGYEVISYSEDIWNLKCPKCQKEFISDLGLIGSRMHISKISLCTYCIPKKSLSAGAFSLNEFIEKNGLQTIKEDRSILKGLEIDILVENKNIGFEFNGIHWHSEKFKDRKYHQNKKLLGLQNNVNIIHIWEDDWNLKNDIIKSRILNILGLTQTKIYARNCKVLKLEDNKIVKSFLVENHIQGYINSKWKYGLFLNDELVSVITLGNRNGKVELLRFSNKLNTNVVGGFSRLFKTFIKENNNIQEVVSYADLDWTDLNDNVYLKNGFIFDSITEPGYFWTDEILRHNRQKFQKHKLVAKGHDSNKTEDQIMTDEGFKKVYNSGNAKYIFKIK